MLFFPLYSYQRACVAVAFGVCIRELSGWNIGEGTDRPYPSLEVIVCVAPVLNHDCFFPPQILPI